MSFDNNPAAYSFGLKAYQAKNTSGVVMGQVHARSMAEAVAKFHKRFDRIDHARWAEGGHWVRPVTPAEAKAYSDSVLGAEVEYRETVTV